MKDTIFDTEEKIAQGISKLSALRVSTGWILIIQILMENIGFLKDRLINGSKEDTIEEINRIRDKIQVYQDLIDTPDLLIKKLSASAGDAIILDPYYDNMEDFKKDIREKIDKDKK